LGEKNLLLEAYRKEIKQGNDINELFKWFIVYKF
jgi:predicted metallo-beta-lactamase superfamily hydrolase